MLHLSDLVAIDDDYDDDNDDAALVLLVMIVLAIHAGTSTSRRVLKSLHGRILRLHGSASSG